MKKTCSAERSVIQYLEVFEITHTKSEAQVIPTIMTISCKMQWAKHFKIAKQEFRISEISRIV